MCDTLADLDDFYIVMQLEGKPSLLLLAHNPLQLQVANHIEAVERLLMLLRDLPTQFIRPGAEDLYGRSVSIMRVTSPGAYMDFFRDQWEIPRPTEEQKVKFDEAMATIDKWSD